MKGNILDINGKTKETIELPSCFSEKLRDDIISKIIEAKKKKQPYAPSPVAGNQHSASGILIHRRKVWKSQYGRGMSRIPRKIFSRRGSQFNWEGATVPNTRGGRRAHPPKILSMINTLKINKKELLLAIKSALGATANEKTITSKYGKLEGKKIEKLPFIVESKLVTLKAKDLISSVQKILGKDLFEVAVKKKKMRSGKGKGRGRKYKSNAGLLIVTGKDEKIKTSAFEAISTKTLGVTNLAKGGAGRLTIYTEKAIKEIGEKFK